MGRTTPRHQANVSTDSPEDTDGWTYPDTRGVGKKYEANMLDFMSWFHGRGEPYPLGTIFTRDELLLVKPVDIHDWLAVACFGIADYDIEEHRPTGCRSYTLLYKKKAVSFFMPNQQPQWCDDRGNPTKAAVVNKLIDLVKKFEARREGAPSHVKRPLTQPKFLLMQKKLQSQTDWAFKIRYRAMNIYQYHLIGRADDTCHFKVRDIRGHKTFDFALQTKVRWSKNVRDERRCPDQIILGAHDPSWCVFIHMAVYIESFLEKQPNAKYLFTDKMSETAPNAMKATWSDRMRKVVWSDPAFKEMAPELDEDGGIGTHSNRKFAADSAAKHGCTSEQVEIRGRWKVAAGKQVMVYIDVKRDYEDAKVCSALCCGAPVKYALKEGLVQKISHQWLCTHVVPHIACRFRNDAKLCHIFGLALLYACVSESSLVEVPEHIRHRVHVAYNGLALEETLPVMKVPLLVHRVGDQLQISEITGNDLLNLDGDGGGQAASAGAVTEALQALYIRSSQHELQLNNIQLTLQALHSELRNFIDSKFRILNNNIRAARGTIVGGFAIQANANGGRLHTLNNPDAPLLNEVVRPARLVHKPTAVLQLWQEYKVGLNGNKPAQQFTMNERNSSRDLKTMWHRRNKVWALIERMIQRGFSAEMAIHRIEQVYGSNISITTLIQKIQADKGDHPNLR